MLICRAGRWLPSIVLGWATMVGGMMMEATTVEIQSWAQFLAEEAEQEAIMATRVRRQTPVTEVRMMPIAPMSILLTSASNPRTQEASARASAFPPASHMESWALARPSACPPPTLATSAHVGEAQTSVLGIPPPRLTRRRLQGGYILST